MTIPRIEFCRGLYSDLLPTDSLGNRITSAVGTRRNLELRNTESCGKYRADINQGFLKTFFFSSWFHIHYRLRSIVRLVVNKQAWECCTRESIRNTQIRGNTHNDKSPYLSSPLINRFQWRDTRISLKKKKEEKREQCREERTAIIIRKYSSGSYT